MQPACGPRGGQLFARLAAFTSGLWSLPPLLRASVAAGANGIFLETHPTPEHAKCDAASQFPLDQLETLMVQANEIAELVRRQGHA